MAVTEDEDTALDPPVAFSGMAGTLTTEEEDGLLLEDMCLSAALLLRHPSCVFLSTAE